MNNTITTKQTLYKSPEGEQAVMNFYEKILSQWPVAHDFVMVPTSQGNTFIIASGKPTAPPLILLHGSGSNSATWMQDVVDYSPEYRVYAVDLPGEPGKSAPRFPDWNGLDYVYWLDDVYQALHLTQASLVGLSLGGYVALKYASHRPEHIIKLVAISTSGICKVPAAFFFKIIFYSVFGQPGMDRIKKLIFGGQEIGKDAEEFFRLTTQHYNMRMGEPPVFSDAELQSINKPLLYLAGAHDPFLQLKKCIKRLQKYVPHTRIKIYPDQAHALINLAGTIIPFLES